MFHALGRAAHRWRWPIIAAWLALFALALVFAPRLSSVLKAGSFLPDDAESARGRSLLQRELDRSPSSVMVLFSSDRLTVDAPRFRADKESRLGSLNWWAPRWL